MRRAVTGRSKSFNELLGDHKAAKEAQLKAKNEAAVMSPAGVTSPAQRSSVMSVGSQPGSFAGVMSPPPSLGSCFVTPSCSPLPTVPRSPLLASPSFSKVPLPSSPWQKSGAQINLSSRYACVEHVEELQQSIFCFLLQIRTTVTNCDSCRCQRVELVAVRRQDGRPQRRR